MRLPWQREKVPAQIREALELAPGERVVAAAQTEDDGYAVASDRALHLVLPADPVADGQMTVVRIRWDLIDNASWSPPALMVELRRFVDAPPERVVLELDRRSEVPAVVRDRVTASIVVNNKVDLGRSWIRVMARRNYDSEVLEWRLQHGPGIDPADPATQALIAEQLDQIRSQWEV